MELTKEYYNLIEAIIRNNRRFVGNEDLFDIFYNETIKRTHNILANFDDLNSAKIYINKIIKSTILEVVRNKDKFKKAKVEIIPSSKEISAPVIKSYKVDEQGDIIFNIPDPRLEIELKSINPDRIKQIKTILIKLDSQENNKKYYDIFTMRYIDGLTQVEIASHLDINESDVNKRLVELIQTIAVHLN